MRTLLTLLLLAAVLLAGCADEDATTDAAPEEEAPMEETPVEEAEVELCHAGDEATALPPVEGYEQLYVVETWLYQESNGVPGLQYTEEPSVALGEVDPKGVGCVGGDTVLF